MVMGEASARIGKMTTMLESFHLGSMRAASALDQLERSKKDFGGKMFPLGATELKEVNRQIEKFENFSAQVAKDTQLRRDLTKTLTGDIETQTGELLKAKTAIASIDARMLGNDAMKGFRKQSLDELRKEVGVTTELIDQGEYRLGLVKQFISLNAENGPKEESAAKKLESLQARLITAKKKAGRDPTKPEEKNLAKLSAQIEATKTELKGYEEAVKKVQDTWAKEVPSRGPLDLSKVNAQIGKFENEIGTMTNKRLQVQTAMVEKQIEENDQSIVANKLRAGFLSHLSDENAEGKAILGGLNAQIVSVQNFVKSAKLIPPQFFILGKLLAQGYDRFVELDSAAEDFRKQTGFSVKQMAALRATSEDINRELQGMGVGIKEVYKSAKALTDVFGRTSLLTKETLSNTAMLASNLGVVEDDTANVLANFQGLGDASEKAAFNVIKVGAGLSAKIGIPFSLVMKDIANASETTMSMLSANPTMLMRSAIAARTLGLDLNKISSSQRKMLDFSTSINDELELSALLGTSISFQKTRQLAYEGRMEEAARSTLETVKAAGNFDKMSVYQREALAKASGMELKDLTKMLAVDKKRSDIMNGSDQKAKDRLLAQEAALKQLNEQADLSKQSLADQYESEIRQQKIQGLITNFTNIFQNLVIMVGDVLEPIVRAIAAILVPAFKLVAALIKGFLAPFNKFATLITTSGEGTSKLGKFFEGIGWTVDKMATGLENIGMILGTIAVPLAYIGTLFTNSFGLLNGWETMTRNIAAWLLKSARHVTAVGQGFTGVMSIFKPFAAIAGIMVRGLAAVAKAAGPIGIIIAAVQALFDLGGQLIDIWSSDKMDIGEKILRSFVAIPKAIWNVLVQPFIDLTAWVLNKIWPGLGDGMINGLKSVGDTIFGWLKWPFQQMFGWFRDESGIAGQSPSEIGMMIVGGIKAIGGMLLDAIVSPFRTAFDFIVTNVKGIGSTIFGFITSPFTKAMEFVKSIPLFGKMFGGNNISVGMNPDVGVTKPEAASVIELKNMDLLHAAIQGLTDAIVGLKSDEEKTATASTATINTTGIEERLDKLTNLLVGGAISVYLDGSRVSGKMSSRA
jgi:hypothetical protein